MVMPTDGFRLERLPCGACDGCGVRAPECHECCGAGFRVEAGEASIDIPKGAEDGARVTVEDEGDVGVCGTKGNLVAIIRVEDDDQFMRRGADLILKTPLKVPLRDALGGTVDVAAPTLDARRSDHGAEAEVFTAEADPEALAAQEPLLHNMYHNEQPLAFFVIERRS